MDWISSIISVSTDLSPAVVEMNTGKKEIRNATSTLGARPKPSHTTNSGATAILDTVCENRNSGISDLSRVDDHTTMMANRPPSTMLQAYPRRTSYPVTRLCA